LKKKLVSTIKLVSALGLGVLIIYLSLKDLTPQAKEDILNSFRMADYSWVIFSIFIGILSHITRAIRWKILLQPMGYNPSTKNSFLAVMVGYFANLGIPRSGEVARCSVLYKEDGIPVNKSFGTVIVERSIDMVLFFSLFFITFLIEYKRLDEYVRTHIYPAINDKFAFISTDMLFGKLALGVVIIGLIVYFIFGKKIKKSSFFQKIFKMLLGIWEGLKSISKIKNPLLFIGYSILIWVFYFLMIYTCLFSLPQTSDLGMSAALTVLVLGSIGIMITPGGIGLYPVIVAQTLVLYGISKESGYGDAIGWITWSAQTIMIIVVGAASLIYLSLNKKKSHELPSKD
jgi:uncharacterized protein (TIRG00374 family)